MREKYIYCENCDQMKVKPCFRKLLAGLALVREVASFALKSFKTSAVNILTC